MFEISQAEKLKLMRESERLIRKDFARIVNIPYSSMTGYETERVKMTVEVAMKIFNHPQFKKYMMWFMTGEIAPEVGQIAPALAHYGQENTISNQSEKKIG